MEIYFLSCAGEMKCVAQLQIARMAQSHASQIIQYIERSLQDAVDINFLIYLFFGI